MHAGLAEGQIIRLGYPCSRREIALVQQRLNAYGRYFPRPVAKVMLLNELVRFGQHG